MSDATDHIAQKAIEAAQAKMKAVCTLVEGRVLIAPAAPSTAKDCPCIILFLGDEDATYSGGDVRNVDRVIPIETTIAVGVARTGIDSLIYSKFNAIRPQVEKAMLPAQRDGSGLGLGETDIRYAKTTRPQASALGDDIAEVNVTHNVFVSTPEGDPSNSIYAQS